jgi:N-acetylglucosamine-6-sulfatase
MRRRQVAMGPLGAGLLSWGLLGLIQADGPKAARAHDPGRPNILFIMSDDHAAHAIGAYGGRLAALDPTPHIDRLAREGLRFENAFSTNSICVPSRATLLTGQYSHTHGLRTLNGVLEPARQLLAHEMRAAGYETAVVGKWHLGAEPDFDHYCVLPGQGSYFNPVLREKGRGAWPDNERRFSGYDSAHSSDVITERSLEWLRRRDRDRPFFLMHHYKAPHDNFENAERYDWLYEDETVPEPASLWERAGHGPDGRPRYGTSVSKRNRRRNMGHHMFVDPDLDDESYTRTAYQRYLKKYLRSVRGVDDGVGRLLQHLEETGELEHTVVFYTSDQGFMLGEHDYIDKRWIYEESLRVPLIVRWPGRVRPGSVSDLLVANVDFAPTLVEIAGAAFPPSMQGRSLVPILDRAPPPDWREAIYYRYWMHMAHHDNPAHYGLRTRDFKLAFFYGLPLDAAGALPEPTPPHWELYDLRRDPREQGNAYADPAYAGTVARLKDELARLKEEVGDTDEGYPELLERARR